MMNRLVVMCAKVSGDEAEAFDKWANSLNMTRSAGLRYLVTTLLKAPEDANRAEQLSWAAKLSKREGVIEGINIFRKAFSRAVDESLATAMEEDK